MSPEAATAPTHAEWERAKMARDADAIYAALLLTRHNDPERAKEYALKAVASNDRMTAISEILDGSGDAK
jgi:hypothetical protein